MPPKTKTGPVAATTETRLEIVRHSPSPIPASTPNSNHFDIAAAKIALRCAVPIAVIAAHLAANFGGLRHG